MEHINDDFKVNLVSVGSEEAAFQGPRKGMQQIFPVEAIHSGKTAARGSATAATHQHLPALDADVLRIQKEFNSRAAPQAGHENSMVKMQKAQAALKSLGDGAAESFESGMAKVVIIFFF